jgi:NhaP-type Na+/H+ or K+/H+ antiporter
VRAGGCLCACRENRGEERSDEVLNEEQMKMRKKKPKFCTKLLFSFSALLFLVLGAAVVEEHWHWLGIAAPS